MLDKIIPFQLFPSQHSSLISLSISFKPQAGKHGYTYKKGVGDK